MKIRNALSVILGMVYIKINVLFVRLIIVLNVIKIQKNVEHVQIQLKEKKIIVTYLHFVKIKNVNYAQLKLMNVLNVLIIMHYKMEFVSNQLDIVYSRMIKDVQNVKMDIILHLIINVLLILFLYLIQQLRLFSLLVYFQYFYIYQ